MALSAEGAESAGGKPEYFANFMREELERMKILVKKINLRLD